MYKVIIKVECTVSPVGTAGISPAYEYANRSMLVRDADDVDTAVKEIAGFLLMNGFTVTKEDAPYVYNKLRSSQG